MPIKTPTHRIIGMGTPRFVVAVILLLLFTGCGRQVIYVPIHIQLNPALYQTIREDTLDIYLLDAAPGQPASPEKIKRLVYKVKDSL